LVFRTKQGRIYAEGSWEQVELRRPVGSLPLETVRVPSFAAPRQIRARREAQRPLLLTRERFGKREFSRDDLCALIGKSRATVNRLLADWVRRGLVKRVGQARSTRYYFAAPVIRDDSRHANLLERE
jgi:hypothetical protein